MDTPDTQPLPHVDAQGDVYMVDVSGKPDTARTAVAEGRVVVGETALTLLEKNNLGQEAPLTIAQIAGIQGAQETSRFLPLCHNIKLEGVDVSFELDDGNSQIRVRTVAKTEGPTGVEMEALMAAFAASLAIYEICKSVAWDATIADVRLMAKSGGQSGEYLRSSSASSEEDPTDPLERSHEKHQKAARSEHVGCAVITVSDTRTTEDDRSGQLIQDRLDESNHEVVRYEIVPDQRSEIEQLMDDLTNVDQVDAILLNGGTGISARDGTYEAVASKLEKKLPGFGELFRMLSYEEVGSAAMLSRATAGVYRERILFSMPGSVNAVKLAMDALIVPELKHLVWEVRRQQGSGRNAGK